MPSLPGCEKRITRSSEYRRVYDDGKKLVGRYLILFYAGPGEMSVGITVSSKIGGSVVRNRAKRRIKEALSKCLNEYPIPYAMVFVALKRINGAAFDEICGDIRALIKKVR